LRVRQPVFASRVSSSARAWLVKIFRGLFQAMSSGTTNVSPFGRPTAPARSVPAASRAASISIGPAAPGSDTTMPSSCTSRQNGPMLTHGLHCPGGTGPASGISVVRPA